MLEPELFIQIIPHKLVFKFDAGTSRGVLTEKTTYYLLLKDKQTNIVGIGEAGPLLKLSIDDSPNFLAEVTSLLSSIKLPSELTLDSVFEYVSRAIPAKYPSLKFALESALLDYLHGGRRVFFDTEFTKGNQSMLTNGLIWMGDEDYMLKQIRTKLDEGFSCLKLKIGAINFDKECAILKSIRNNYSSADLELRVDANGAFKVDEAFEKMTVLSKFDIHSIEQPIKAGQITEMKKLCAQTPLPIALDEELIGCFSITQKMEIINEILPQYIVLKPTLLGGFKETNEWISIVNTLDINWWITSALESNIGLAAISQYASQFKTTMPQGLGTGQLYVNNLTSPLSLSGERLFYNLTTSVWDLKVIEDRF